MAKKVKEKKCRVCGTMFVPYRSTMVVCSTMCAYQYAAQKRKEKEAKNKKDLDQARKEKKDKQSLQYLKTNVTAICHQYIRKETKVNRVLAVALNGIKTSKLDTLRKQNYTVI